MCRLDVEILTFTILILAPIYHPSEYQFHTKTPILLKLDTFYDNLLEIQPIYVNWAPSSAMKTPDGYTKICKQPPEKASTHTLSV